MHGFLCALSPARLAMLKEEPDLLHEIAAVRREKKVPGLVNLEKAWHALCLLLDDCPEAKGLGQAVTGRGGQSIGPDLAYGKAKLLDAVKVKKLAAKLAALSSTYVQEHYGTLGGQEVHGGYGHSKQPSQGEEDGVTDDPEAPDELDELSQRLASVIELYQQAASKEQSMLIAIL
jgi:hypothetical protein